MDVLSRKISQACIAYACCMLPYGNVLAVVYNYPANFPPQVVPFTLGSGDILNVNSGTMMTTTSATYTIDFLANIGIQTTTINSGATVGYGGTNVAGRAISSTRNDSIVSIENINNYGTLDSGTGLYAIYMSNSNAASANLIQITTTGTIKGNIFCNGVDSNLEIDGQPAVAGTSLIQGGITLTPRATNPTRSSAMHVGQFSPTTYITGGTIQGVTDLWIYNATMTLAFAASQMGNISNGGTFNVNNTLSGLLAPATDGDITNQGIMNISANITKTGAFLTELSGVTNVRQAVTVNTSTFDFTGAGRYGSILTDILNYGNVTLNVVPTFQNFDLVYEGGYFPGRTYTLVTATAPMTIPSYTTPTNTMFLTFNPPVPVGNTIQTVITRTPFQTYAQSSMTQLVATALESIGASANPPADMVTLLNALEVSTSVEQLNYALRQLAPLISAPLYGIEVQSEMLEQVELRLAEARTNKTYMAGDLSTQNAVWLRPFGDKANQQAMGDGLGYYASTGGLAFGFDRYVDTGFILGVAGSYALSHVTDKINSASNTDIKSYQVMLYGSVDLNTTKYLNWAVAAAANNYDAIRYVNLSTLQLQAKSTYSSQIYGIKGVWGQNISAFNFLQVNPEASAQYTFAKQYQYSETDGQGANLQVNRENSNVVQLGLGGKLSTPIEWHPGIFIPEIHAMTYYNVVNGQQSTTSNFLSGGGVIIANMPLPRTWLKFGASVTFAILDQMQVKIDYDHWIADRFTDNTFYINFKYSL